MAIISVLFLFVDASLTRVRKFTISFTPSGRTTSSSTKVVSLMCEVDWEGLVDGFIRSPVCVGRACVGGCGSAMLAGSIGFRCVGGT